jgi:tetratricopeptide (TPR) repeat protein
MLFFAPRHPPERIATSFRWLEPRPLPTLDADFYSGRYERGGYALELRKDSYFAWETLSAGQSYSDVVLEADLEMDPSNGHSAVGLLFRHVNDENFYSFLLSTRGNFRIDVLFNKHPLRLVDWTPAPEPDSERSGGGRLLRIVAHGSRFSFHIDDEWVAELEDETLPAGGVGFAAQNYAGAARGTFRMRRLIVDARPLVVEREHTRWRYFAPVSPAARLRLAETLYTSGSFDAAAVQLRKGLKGREGTPREHFLLAECYLHLSLNEDALSEIDRVLALDPARPEAALEKANILYLSQRLLEARDCLIAGFASGAIQRGPGAQNLLGNAEYALGNWDAAIEAYGKALEREPDMPLFLQNAARSMEMAVRDEEAVDLYLRAARILFAEEAFDELSLIVSRVLALAPDDPRVRALEAKMLYREGKTDEACTLLQQLEDDGSDDSAVHYLLGLILAAKGRKAEALPRFTRAAELEKEFPLYQFRLAETQHSLGRDPAKALATALALSPTDPWANNLAGQLRLEARDPAGAIPFLEAARAALPMETDICLNLSEALSIAGRGEEAMKTIESLAAATEDGARLANQRGTIAARQGDRERAVQEYETAIRLDPRTPAYKENCAAACIQLDMVHRAEELLAQVEPEHPSASIYNLLGQVAVLKGERARAELAYQAGMELDPDNVDIALNLALVRRERGKHEEARDLLLSLLDRHPGHARARALLQRIRDERETRITCASCGREWWVPRELPPQPGIRIRGEPPGDAPAGKCPRCGKVYCVECASAHLHEMRFHCPDCDEPLKISDDALKWLLARAIEGPAARSGAPSPGSSP